MEIGHGFHPFDRVERLRHLPPADPAVASPRDQRHPALGASVRADIRQERLTADHLRTEIVRLRTILDQLDLIPIPLAPETGTSGDCPTTDATSPTRKSYAPPPVGQITPRAAPPRAEAAPAAPAEGFHVTNLGTRLDVMA